MRRAAAPIVLAVALAPGSLCAQTPPQNEAGTLRFGSLSIHPSLTLKDIGRDANVFNEAVDPRSDFTMTIAPRADVFFQPGRLKLTFSQGTDYVYFRQYASERGMNQTSSLRADVDLGVLQPYATIGGTNTKSRYNNEVDARARYRDRSYSAGVGLRLFTRTTASAGVRRVRHRFDEGVTFRGESLADAFNSTIEIVEGSVGVALTPLTKLSVNVSREHQRFDRAVDRDSRSLRVMPTLTFSPLALLNGSVAVGYRRFTAEDPSLQDFTGLVAVVTAGVSVYDRHRFDVTVNRDLNYSYEQESPYYIATGGSVTWTYLVAGPFDVKTSAALNRMRYRARGAGGAPSDDTYSSYAAGVGYRLRRHLRFGVNADWARRDSQRSSDRAFENNRIYGTVTWGS
jgi:hypothetical protein